MYGENRETGTPDEETVNSSTNNLTLLRAPFDKNIGLSFLDSLFYDVVSVTKIFMQIGIVSMLFLSPHNIS